MRVLRLREKLHRRGLLLLKHGTGFLVTNAGTAKTLIEHEFADADAVEAWIPHRLTDAEAEEFDEQWAKFVNQCDGCRRGLPLDENGIHVGPGFDMIGCTADRYGSK